MFPRIAATIYRMKSGVCWSRIYVAGNLDRQTGLRMADDRGEPLQGSSACGRGTRRPSGDGPYSRGLNTKIHRAVNPSGLPVRVLITEGTRADCTQASRLMEGIDADDLIADQGYDTDTILEQAAAQGMNAVIPPKKNRKAQRPYNEARYKLRHRVENTFLMLTASPPATLKTPPLSSPLSISAASPFGSISRDYSI